MEYVSVAGVGERLDGVMVVYALYLTKLYANDTIKLVM